MASAHLQARRRLLVGALAATLLGVVIGPARAVHPGTDGGLGYATPDEIRVRTADGVGGTYALPAEGVTDLDKYAVSPGTPVMPDFFVPAAGARTVVGRS